MNCNDSREALSSYLDNELPSDVQLIISVHLVKCPNCQGLLEQFQQIQSVLREEVQLIAAEELWQRIAPSLRNRSRNASSSTSKDPTSNC